jgi:hypothetical protein
VDADKVSCWGQGLDFTQFRVWGWDFGELLGHHGMS